MNLRDLDYLVAVAEQRHFGRAAKACHVSQPTLSAQIRKLEEELGVALFERDSRNVALTAAGASVLDEARAALSHAAVIRDIARAHRDPLAGRLRLGIVASLGPFFAADLLAQVAYDAPRLEVDLVEDLTEALLTRLRDRRLDAALLASVPDGDDLRSLDLFDEPLLLGHAPDHPLATVVEPDMEAVGRGPLLLLAEGHCLRDQALALCGATSVDPRLRAGSLLTVMALAARGLGVTLVPALAARWAEGLMLRPLGRDGAARQIRLATRRNHPGSGAIDAVALACRAVAAERGLAPP